MRNIHPEIRRQMFPVLDELVEQMKGAGLSELDALGCLSAFASERSQNAPPEDLGPQINSSTLEKTEEFSND